MSRFYGDLTGQARTTATRRGSASSGVSAHIRGWGIGVRVNVHDEDGRDVVSVTLTGGSNSTGMKRCLGSWVLGDNGEVMPKA